jgi:lipopolysaccharide/colanic/teichoic acid biosynthesis glycosyltransferase
MRSPVVGGHRHAGDGGIVGTDSNTADLATPTEGGIRTAGAITVPSDHEAEPPRDSSATVLDELTKLANPGIGITGAGEGALADPSLDVVLPGENLGARLAKRAFDMLVATLLLVVLLPLIAVVALLIKLDSSGPVLYRSRRIGRNGASFEMLKFRTMFDGADGHRDALRPISEAPEGLFKVTDDPRLTGVGQALRSTSLDELPQLIHVITGTMSLVGPRPLVAEESDLISPNSSRFLARPGITGPWQLAGSWRVSLPEMVKLDVEYLESWSIWLDLKMLLGTAWYALRRTGC